MTIYYRVNLAEGIKPEKQKQRFYSKSPELGVTVFKSLRASKRKFNEITAAELERIKAMRQTIRAVDTREQLLNVS